MLIFSRTFEWGSVISNFLLNCYKKIFPPLFNSHFLHICVCLLFITLSLTGFARWFEVSTLSRPVMSVGVICHITSSACSHCCICLRRQPGKENQITFTCPVMFSSKRLLWPCLCTKCVCVYILTFVCTVCASVCYWNNYHIMKAYRAVKQDRDILHCRPLLTPHW